MSVTVGVCVAPNTWDPLGFALTGGGPLVCLGNSSETGRARAEACPDGCTCRTARDGLLGPSTRDRRTGLARGGSSLESSSTTLTIGGSWLACTTTDSNKQHSSFGPKTCCQWSRAPTKNAAVGLNSTVPDAVGQGRRMGKHTDQVRGGEE